MADKTPSRKLILHVDGSNVYVPRSEREGLGWAVIACHDDALHERYGGFEHSRRGPLMGCHEQIAFIQGVLYAHEQNFRFEDVTLLCDDMLLGYAKSWLHPGNFSMLRADAARARIAHVVSHLYPTETIGLVLEAIEKCVTHKLKGHSLMVYQERADYLAKAGAQEVCGLSVESPLAYEDWLRRGIKNYDPASQQVLVWHAPFVRP